MNQQIPRGLHDLAKIMDIDPKVIPEPEGREMTEEETWNSSSVTVTAIYSNMGALLLMGAEPHFNNPKHLVTVGEDTFCPECGGKVWPGQIHDLTQKNPHDQECPYHETWEDIHRFIADWHDEGECPRG